MTGALSANCCHRALLRSTAFFSGAGGTTAIVVLTCWAIAGAVLIIIAGVPPGLEVDRVTTLGRRGTRRSRRADDAA